VSLQQNVACTVTVKLDTGSSNALETWCESIDGISIREQLFKEPIHSDSNGGTATPRGGTALLDGPANRRTRMRSRIHDHNDEAPK